MPRRLWEAGVHEYPNNDVVSFPPGVYIGNWPRTDLGNTSSGFCSTALLDFRERPDLLPYCLRNRPDHGNLARGSYGPFGDFNAAPYISVDIHESRPWSHLFRDSSIDDILARR